MTIKLHPTQSTVYRDLFVHKKMRNAVVCCSRGWGKSHLAAAAASTAVFELMTLSARVPNKLVHIIAPTYEQVTDIYFPLISDILGMDKYAIKMSRDLGRFQFPRNVELRLLSYEAVERMRGKGSYFTVWDEVSSCKRGLAPKEAWQQVIQPCMTTRWSPKNAARYDAPSAGRSLTIGTPKGFNFFYDMFNLQETDSNWKSYHYNYHFSPLLDPNEIEKLRNELDPISFASEYEALFKESGLSVFYTFDRNVHVRKDVPDFIPPADGNMGEIVYANIDFNVGLQCTSLMAIRGGQVHIVDELKGHPDTETLAMTLRQKYKNHKIIAFPDPTGRSRKTSAAVGRTDFTILNDAGIETLARSASPSIVDSVAAVNRMLMTASKHVSMYVHPRCSGVIKSLERTKWVESSDSAIIDKSESVEHFSDGLRYGIEYMFPVLHSGPAAIVGKTF